MKKLFAIIFSMLTAHAVTYGQCQGEKYIQKLTTKNGSVLYGFIEQQDGKGNFTFHSDSASVYLSNKGISISERSIPLASLDKVWVSWAERNDAFVGVGNDRTFILNDITNSSIYLSDSAKKADAQSGNYLLRNRASMPNVKVVEKGVRVKYVELTPNNYTLSWENVASIKSERRPRTALSGVNRIFQLKNGDSFEGQYAEETFSTISIYMPDGMMQSFRINDIVKYSYHPINPNQDIFEQSELVDIVRQKSGAPVSGIIVEQNYTSQKNEENYLLIREENGTIRSIRATDILSVIKERNKKYAPQYDILLKNGEVVINRLPTNYVGVREADDVLVIDSINTNIILDQGANNATKVTVEYRNDAAKNVDMFQLVKVSKFTIKKNTFYGFTYKNLVDAVYRPTNVETSVNLTTKAEYTVGGKGCFVLYDAKNKRAIPFIVK